MKIRRTIYETLDNTPETLIPTNVYLTNTLTPPNTDVEQDGQMSLFDFSAAISDEAYKADTWKARRPIKVIIGNPPYLAASTTPFDISAYKTEADGAIKYKNGVLHLNANKQIHGIPEDVWTFRIGGYQVLDKWFKSHKGEIFGSAEFEHICNVVGLLAETIKVMAPPR